MKSTQGSLMDPADLAASDVTAGKAPEEKVDQPVKNPVDVLHDFVVTEKPTPDTFIQKGRTETTRSSRIRRMFQLPMTVRFSEDTCWDREMKEADGSGLDKFPEFPGGTDAVRRYIELTVNYPLQAIKQKINGVVIVSFDVNRQGAVDNIKVERGVHPMLDKEAIKAVKNMPRWKPGVRHGKPVIVKFVIPVRFMPVS